MFCLEASTSDKLRLTAGSAADLEQSVHYLTYGSTPPLTPSAILGKVKASITSTTPTDILVGAASTFTVLKYYSCYNRSATSTTVLIEHQNGTDTNMVAFCTLLQNEGLVMTENGVWIHYDANGAAYPSVGNKASQAEAEAGTADDKYLTPLSVNWHPGACKFWVLAGISGNVLASWNVTSLTDTGTGDLTVTIATDFSSANWCCQVSNEGESTTLTASGNVNTPYVRTGGLAAGSVRLNSRDAAPTTNVLNDPATWSVAGFGDQ